MKYELTWNRIKELIQVDGLVANYDQDRQMVRFTSNDNHKIADLNDWLLECFPHYLDNISYNVNSPAFDVQDRIGYYWLELICISKMENKTEIIYDFLLEYEIATENEISLVCSINGTNEDSLNSIIYSKTGYHSMEQLKECEEI